MPSYQTIRKLSDGAAADVFLARGENEEPVILEVMRPELTQHGDLVERFLGEARMRHQLEHPHLARRVRGGHTRDGRPYVVTEPIRGETLRTYLQARGALSADQVVKLALPLCGALGYLHHRGVVHKNLTPASVFLPGGLEAMQPKLFDASLSLLRGGTATTPRHGTSVVEAAYMAPERVAGQRADVRSDLYSLGVLLSEALTGRATWADGPPPAPGHEALAEVIARCTAKNPSSRYPTARALRDALVEASRRTLILEEVDIQKPAPQGMMGPYVLLEVLGEGAIGQVFRAHKKEGGPEVALKVMRAEHARNPRLVRRFRDEARAIRAIGHPHIVRIEEVPDEPLPDGTLYCVMELLHGCTLETVLNGESLSVRRSVQIARQVCGALEAAHAVGVIHRDVKPANIFLEEPGERDRVKLLDFGVAKLRLEGAEPNPEMTQQGALLGTPTYMAPEQTRSGDVDARADVYALGTTLYRMLAGCLPFGGPSFNEFVAQVQNDPPAPLPRATIGSEAIPAPLRELVMQCLEKDPARRPPSARALRERLDACRVPARGRRRAAWAGAGLAVLIAAGGAAWWLARERPALVSAPVAAPAPAGPLAPLPAAAPAVAAPAPAPKPDPAPAPAKRAKVGKKHRQR